MSTKKDTIVRELTGAEINVMKGSPTRAADIRSGTATRIWGVAGQWVVWSAGPESNSWWLQPRDGAAVDVYRTLREKRSRGEPVVLAVMQGCVAVGTRDLHVGRAAA
ncbi:hypothetical protein [Cellulosimicrobium aquatile]|uniref:hypothetical protein n=1 Tax=Cellulosimicrobium aquatile TaxID=1612203 RepID=UPI001459A428|nr:hypothetical protein [Cellulosimicrobium aquatile]NMF29621.1 hypothetical protein [Cellulosimicrobium aquatile]